MFGFYGGKLRDEYRGNLDVMRIVLQLERAGRARLVSSELILQEQEAVKAIGGMKSNDLHVLALARAANVRLLCTNDGALQKDFTNLRFIKPQGRIYKRPNQGHLLQECCGSKSKKLKSK
jgi:predicted nucleic acid-binding protein